MPATITLIRADLANLRIRRTHTTRNDSWQRPLEGVKAASSVERTLWPGGSQLQHRGASCLRRTESTTGTSEGAAREAGAMSGRSGVADRQVERRDRELEEVAEA
jgi:hypothetical protein